MNIRSFENLKESDVQNHQFATICIEIRTSRSKLTYFSTARTARFEKMFVYNRADEKVQQITIVILNLESLKLYSYPFCNNA